MKSRAMKDLLFGLKEPCLAGVLVSWSPHKRGTRAGRPHRHLPRWPVGDREEAWPPGRRASSARACAWPVDEARPAFAEVGQKSPRRETFWYRRTFRVKGDAPAVALLKVHKAADGSRVLLNGVLLGEHLPSFTPGTSMRGPPYAAMGRKRTGRQSRGHARGAVRLPSRRVGL